MKLLGNIVWLIFGGLFIAASWLLISFLLCITVIGIPFGIQAFKMAKLTLTPFGKHVIYRGGTSTIWNILWIVFFIGPMLALGYIVSGFICCCTIVGIPFGIQSFKMAKLALWPFGSEIVEDSYAPYVRK
ncbi:YccF domain-containing protein [Gardnerella swidsinskii]|uniref:YccF domain-containing protein n=1 Tax=Gardnerella TaxID=2701 RepID=UPI0001D85864|nr:hypothetical membrane protein [Gardnerella vaginalis 5-1]RIY30127.1 YccF family protein [Bifidobacteriaceae bacterium NR016]